MISETLIGRINDLYSDHIVKNNRDKLPVGEQILIRFKNDYGASLINTKGTYGNEIAVIAFDGDDWHITYDTELTDDIIDGLTERGVMDTLNEIKNLSGEEQK